MNTVSGLHAWRRAASVLLPVGVLTALGLYLAVTWQAHHAPLEISPWNDRWALIVVAVCASLCGLLLAGRARLMVWLAAGSVLALLLGVAVLGGAGIALLTGIWIALIALTAGDATLALIARDVSWGALERVTFGWVIGFAAVGFGVFLLALGGWLYRDVTIGILVAGSAASIAWWMRRRRGMRLAAAAASEWGGFFATQPVLSAFVLAAASLALLGAIVWSVAPEIRTDALVYQLAVPQAYVNHHGLVNLPGNFRSYWTGLANMWSTLGLLLAGQPLPQLLVLFHGVLLAMQALVLFAWLGGPRVGLIAAGLIATTPYLLRLESTTMTDIPAAVLAFAAIAAATRWWSDRRLGWLTVFGVLAGSAIAARANAAFVVLPAFIVVGWGIITWERDRAAAAFARMLVPLLATASPWLLLRWRWTGNPIFPLLNERFPNQLWGPGSARLDWDVFGLGTGAGDFLRLPWDLTVSSGAFAGTGAPPGVYGLAVLLPLPPFLLVLSRRERERWIPLLAAALAGSAIWFLNTPYFRYALPLLPILCGLSAMNIVLGYDAVRARFPSSRLLPAAAVVLATAYLVSTRLVTTASIIREPERYPVSVALGQETREAYLTRHLEEMPALSAMVAAGAVGDVLALGMNHGLYYPGTITDMLDFSPRYRYLFESDDPEALLTELHDRGFQYLLINWSSASRYLTRPAPFALEAGAKVRDAADVPLLLSHTRFLTPYLTEIFTGNGFSVFAIPGAGARAPGVETEALPAAGCRETGNQAQDSRAGRIRQACVAVAPEPVLAGLSRGSAIVEWETGSRWEGEVVLAIDGGAEIPLAAGRRGQYTLKQLAPGFNYVVRLYVAKGAGRTLAAESPVRVWTD